jgi:hypothetical protein
VDITDVSLQWIDVLDRHHRASKEVATGSFRLRKKQGLQPILDAQVSNQGKRYI